MAIYVLVLPMTRLAATLLVACIITAGITYQLTMYNAGAREL